MYAVIRSGGKQYRVEPGKVVKVERLPGKVGGKVTFSDILAVGGDGPLAAGEGTAKTKVTGVIVEQGRAKKIRVFKFKKKNQYKILRGHRQNLTTVRVDKILTAEKP